MPGRFVVGDGHPVGEIENDDPILLPGPTAHEEKRDYAAKEPSHERYSLVARMKNKDPWVATALGVACLLVYWLTLYPGVVGTADTPRLQLVGPVLGTAHTPGYPIYTLVSHAFTRIPLGSYAYRANLLSACLASLTVVLGFLLARRLGAGHLASAIGVLAMSFGPVFWSQALLAEVYSLGAALMVGMMLALIAWAATGRLVFLLAAAGCLALGLGHRHVDVIASLPAMLLFLYLYRGKRPLQRRDVSVAAAVAASGLLSYGYIVARTVQGAPYLATRASSLSELFVAWRGGSFSSQLFAFGLGELLSQRVPRVGGILLAELSPAGVALAAVGVWALSRRLRKETLLLLAAAAGNVFFVLNYAATDLAVFLIPSVVLLWPFVAVGAGEIAEWARRAGRTSSGVAVAGLVLLPIWQLASHYRANDHHARSLETRFLRALFATLPDKTAFVRENDIVDSMLLYQLLAEPSGAGRDIILIPADQESVEVTVARGYEVFAFPRSAQHLSPLGFGFVPVTLLDEPLAAQLARLRSGSPVIVAAAAGAPDFVGTLDMIGARPGSGRGPALAAIGRIEGNGQVEVGSDVRLELAAGVEDPRLGWVPTTDIEVLSREGAAAIRVAGRSTLRTEDGVAVVTLAPGGRVAARLEADAREGWRVPFSVRPLALHRLAFPRACSKPAPGWQDVTDRTTSGRVLIRGGSVEPFVLYASHLRPFSPRLEAGSEAVIHVESFDVSAPEQLAASLLRDGLQQDRVDGRSRVTRISVDEPAGGALRLDFGGIPTFATARLVQTTLCAAPTGGYSFFEGDRIVEKLDLTARGTPFLGDGWGRPREDGPFVVREMESQRGELLIPSATSGPIRVHLQARLEGAPDDARLELAAGGGSAGSRSVESGWRDYEWDIPAGSWSAGTNLVSLAVTAGRLEVRKLHFLRQ